MNTATVGSANEISILLIANHHKIYDFYVIDLDTIQCNNLLFMMYSITCITHDLNLSGFRFRLL